MTVIMLKTMLINLRFKYTKNDLDFHMTYLSFNDTIVTENLILLKRGYIDEFYR